MRVVIESTGATEIQARLLMREHRMHDLRHGMQEAANVVYEQTRQWMESYGEGTWPELAESTIISKEAQGAMDPSRPLYFEGNLFESATSSAGPYSYLVFPDDHSVALGVDWDVDGWQIPVVLHGGTDSAGPAGDTVIPPRPIWPAHSSQAYQELRRQVRRALREAVEL